MHIYNTYAYVSVFTHFTQNCKKRYLELPFENIKKKYFSWAVLFQWLVDYLGSIEYLWIYLMSLYFH